VLYISVPAAAAHISLRIRKDVQRNRCGDTLGIIPDSLARSKNTRKILYQGASFWT
jgi:hypothetical protein